MRCFTAVLGFGKLVRDLQMEELDDDEALPVLEKLHSTFEVRPTHPFSPLTLSFSSFNSTPSSTHLLVFVSSQASSSKFIYAISVLDSRGTTTTKPEATQLQSSLQEGDQDLLALISGEEKGRGAGLADLVLRLDFKGVVSDRHELRSGSRRRK